MLDVIPMLEWPSDSELVRRAHRRSQRRTDSKGPLFSTALFARVSFAVAPIVSVFSDVSVELDMGALRAWDIGIRVPAARVDPEANVGGILVKKVF